jgi:hypothetical protein
MIAKGFPMWRWGAGLSIHTLRRDRAVAAALGQSVTGGTAGSSGSLPLDRAARGTRPLPLGRGATSDGAAARRGRP